MNDLGCGQTNAFLGCGQTKRIFEARTVRAIKTRAGPTCANNPPYQQRVSILAHGRDKGEKPERRS